MAIGMSWMLLVLRCAVAAGDAEPCSTAGASCAVEESSVLQSLVRFHEHVQERERATSLERTEAAQAVSKPTLHPDEIPKFVTPLVIPPAMKRDRGKEYSIELRQFQQQILPGGIWNDPGFGLLDRERTYDFQPTTVWSYGPSSDPLPDSSASGGGPGVAPAANSQFNYPAYTVEAVRNEPTVVRWINGLVKDPVMCRSCRKREKTCLRLCQCSSCRRECETSAAKCMGSCNHLPHLLPVDQTLHWANPGRLPCKNAQRTTDCRVDPSSLSDPTELLKPYVGPVPMVVHVHGSHSSPESDGYPEAWYLPDANDIQDFAREGTFVNVHDRKTNVAGEAHFKYSNDQPSTTLWFHDHTLGMTRQNVYAGPAGFWIVRDGQGQSGETGLVKGRLPGPAPEPGAGLAETNLPGARERYREIPIVIQDRSFNKDGSLFYPDSRAFFSLPNSLDIPYIGTDATTSDIPPIWNPEAFFDVMVVNGVSWPALKVKRGTYRFRLLNGCNSRFLNLFLVEIISDGSGGEREGKQLAMYQIGADQSLLPKVVKITLGKKTVLEGNGEEPSEETSAGHTDEALLMGPAERADIIVNFSSLSAGSIVRMRNTAPDGPFAGFPLSDHDAVPADPKSTGQVMEFHVEGDGPDPLSEHFTPPKDLVLSLPDSDDPAASPEAPASMRELALLEESSSKICVQIDEESMSITYDPSAKPIDSDTCTTAEAGGPTPVPFAPKSVVLGVRDGAGMHVTLWSDPIATNPRKNSMEEWVIWNPTADAHPIHLHLVKFRVHGRQAFDEGAGAPTGEPLELSPTEAGWKDTVIALPGQVTRVRASFDIAGLYVWHCHILEHEDNEMMVPYCVGDMDTDPACRLANLLSAHSAP